ncbi:MAG: tetraacyldisaccharide 4'-kinase [Rhodoferax sp.]|nr:tetraacyldisaccharide 4'-kinase [Rhodoferax sp.]
MPRAHLHSWLTRAWTDRGLPARLLWPLAWLFGRLVALRQALYRWGLMSAYRCAVPVIVVGNVVAGGAGKTPMVMELVRHLQRRGVAVGVVARGHGGRVRGCLDDEADTPPALCGDEPALIRRSTGVPVVVGRRRTQAAQWLLRHHPRTQLMVCDDGLQHLALARDFEICVFDDRGIGNGWLLPAGPLREPWPRQVDLLLHTGPQPAFSGLRVRRRLADHAQRSDGTRIALALLGAAPARPLMALAGIAHPQAFFDMLREQGLQPARVLELPDHYDFDSWNPNIHKGYQLICTEKDAVKLWPHDPSALAVALELAPEEGVWSCIDSWLARHLGPPPGAPLSSAHGHTTA